MALWQDFYNYASRLVKLKEQTDKNTADIKDLQQEVKELITAVQRLAYELKLDRETEAKDREILSLRLENQLLRLERRLPPPSSPTEE